MVSFATTKTSNYDTIAWIDDYNTVFGYQLDYVGNLTSSVKFNKTNSWFNDTMITNIDYSRYIKNSEGLQTKNWQQVYSNTSISNKTSNVLGYGMTYVYHEIPGYYLEYIDEF